MRHHLAHIGQFRQLARGDDAFPAAIAGRRGAGVFHQHGQLAPLLARPQAALTAQFCTLETQMWDWATSANDDAVGCEVIRDPCIQNRRFAMQMVEISPADQQMRRAAGQIVLLLWRDACLQVDQTCPATWNQTVGSVAGLTIR